jgi:hypothetical protein
MMQMFKDIFHCVRPGRCDFVGADNIKFLAVLVPSQHDRVDFSLAYEGDMSGLITIHASLFAGTLVFFKMKATLRLHHE